jgi:Mrp family chromosome partitioning ATPase
VGTNMSALDRAYIRAYARGTAPQTPLAEEAFPPQSAGTNAATTSGAELESLYAAGSLYRVDWKTAEPNNVPPPHQPAAATRRRLRFSQPSSVEAAPRPVAPPSKPAQTYRQPLSLVAAKLRESGREAPPVLLELEDRVDLPQPASVATPESERVELTPQVQITVSNWQLQDIPPAMVVAPLASEKLVEELAPSLVTQHFDSLPAAVGPGAAKEPEPAVEREYELVAPAETAVRPVPPPIEDPVFRLDAGPTAIPKPHFGRKPAPPAPPPAAEPVAALEPEVAEIIEAEAVADSAPIPASEPQVQPNAAPEAPFMPLWEVDNFHWPAVCERLLAGEQSYFAQSGEKLKYAVQDGLRVLAVAATRRGDGSTTLALCLARSAAAAGLNVALVDADFSRPEMADCLGLEVECGWQTVAAGQAPLADAAIRSLEDRLTVFPIKADEKHKLTLADPRAGQWLRSVASHFDLVLVDMGHVTGGMGPLLPATAPAPIDAAVVVRDARSVTESSARIVGLKLHAAGIEAVGLAENFGQEHA